MQSLEPASQATFESTHPPAVTGNEVSLLDILIAIARRLRFILGFTAVAALIAIVVSLRLPKVYTATAVILPPQTSSSGSAVMSQLSALGSAGVLAGATLGIKNPNDMYVSMFRTRSVEDAMIRRFNLMDQYHATRMSDTRLALEKHATIQSGTKDNLITVSVEDTDPKRSADLANGYVEEFRKFSGTLAISEASQRRLFFEQQLQQVKGDVAKAEEALKRTEQTSGLVQIDTQTRALVESAASLRAQIAAKQVEIRAMRSFASDQNPSLQMAEQQLAGWQAQLSSLGGNQAGSGDDLLLAKGRVPEAGLEYVRKLRDVKYYDTIFDLLARQFEIAKIDEARQGTLVQVVDPALPPDRRSSPNRALIVLLTMVAALILSTLWVLLVTALAYARKVPEYREQLETLRRTVKKTFLLNGSFLEVS